MVHLGRPDIAQLLGSWAARLADLPAAPAGARPQVVCCGMGPERLVKAAERACCELSGGARGPARRPYFRFVARTYEM